MQTEHIENFLEICQTSKPLSDGASPTKKNLYCILIFSFYLSHAETSSEVRVQASANAKSRWRDCRQLQNEPGSKRLEQNLQGPKEGNAKQFSPGIERFFI